jgi:3-oxoacyl-[acyl-carrier-protein] synthase-3
VRIINSAARRLGLSSDKVIVNIDRYGNTSAASIPIALDEALEQGKIKYREDGQTLKIALVGFGAGLTWGATIIEI